MRALHLGGHRGKGGEMKYGYLNGIGHAHWRPEDVDVRNMRERRRERETGVRRPPPQDPYERAGFGTVGEVTGTNKTDK